MCDKCPTCKDTGIREEYDHHSTHLVDVKCDCKKPVLTLDQELKRDGYDGLYCSEGECACEIGDLHPCGEYCEECKPGYKKTYNELSKEMKELYSPDSGIDWFIVRDK